MISCVFDDGGRGNLRHVCVDSLVCVDDKVLLVKRSSKLSSAPGKYCMPGGYLDRSEFLGEAAARETKEETGYEVETPILFHVRDYPGDLGDNDRQNVVFTFVFEKAKKISETLDWDSESNIWVPLDGIDKIKDLIAFDHWQIIKAYVSFKKDIIDLPIFNAYLNFNK